MPLMATPRSLCFASDFLDRRHSLDVPRELIPRQLDFEMGQPVEKDPIPERLGKIIRDRRKDVGWRQWIEPPTR